MRGQGERSVLSWPLLLPGALLVGFLVLPFLALIGALPHADRTALTDGEAAGALVVSLVAATAATLVDGVLGVPLGLWLARTRSRARHAVTVAVLLPLAVPPVVGGLELILLLGPNGWLGSHLARFGLNPLDTIAGTVLAQMFVAAPFVVISARAAFDAVDSSVGEAALMLGCGPGQTFFRALLPAAQRGVVVGLVLGWVRCLGEFGATAVLAYHPYTLPTLTYVDLSGRGLSTALPVGALLATVGAIVAAGLLWIDARSGSRLRRAGAGDPPEFIDGLDWIRSDHGAGDGLEVRAAVTVGRFELDVRFASPSPAIAILGPSGAGKSLTLRTIAGLLRPTLGSISIGTGVLLDRGEGIDLDPARRRLGYVAQRDGLFDHLDVEANISFGLTGVAPQERARRVAELLMVTGLTRVRHQRPATLSAGERQRVALARALAPGPRALLLDEPFSNLDAPIRRQLRRLVREVHDRTGLPVVLVTHDRDDALDVSDFVVVLDQGRVIQQGAIEDVFARPVSAPVARLVGIPNVLTVDSVEPQMGSSVRVRTAWGTVSVKAPQHVAEEWGLAVPVEAVRAAGDGTTASIHSVRPAPGGWRVTLTLPGSAQNLEGLMAGDDSAPRPVAGQPIGVRIAGERCHLMPTSSPDTGTPGSPAIGVVSDEGNPQAEG